MSEPRRMPLPTRRDFRPGELAWVTQSRQRALIPIVMCSTGEFVSIDPGGAVTIIRKALARDMPREWQRQTIGTRLTFARYFTASGWVVLWDDQLVIINDKNLNRRIYKSDRRRASKR